MPGSSHRAVHACTPFQVLTWRLPSLELPSRSSPVTSVFCSTWTPQRMAHGVPPSADARVSRSPDRVAFPSVLPPVPVV